MKVAEVKVLMHENFLFIDVGHALPQCGAYERDDCWSCFDLCTEEEREVMELLEEMETRRR